MRRLLFIILLMSLGSALKGQVKQIFPEDSTIINKQKEFTIKEIRFTGNKQTKEKIIRREITVTEGDRVTIKQLEDKLNDSYENLKNTPLFNFIKIEAHYLLGNEILLLFDFEERWYIWPFPVFDYNARNFSEFVKNERWDRLIYGMYLKVDNFRGRNETIKVKAIAGYKKQLELFYYTPQLDKKQRIGLESYITYNMWDNIDYMVFENKLESYKDTTKIIRSEVESTTTLFYRKKHRDRHRLAFSYIYGSVDDTIVDLNANYFGKGNSRVDYLRLIYHYYNDHRDYKIYPLNGYYWDVFLVNEYENRSDFYNLYFQGSFRVYNKVANRLYVSSGVKGKVSSSKVMPFYINRGIGFQDYLRGFEEYVTLAPNYVVNKNNLKFEIVKNQLLDLSFIPVKKFNRIPFAAYVNLFVDSGYSYYKYSNPENNMANSLLLSTGLSLDLVTYYDKVISIGYGLTNFNEGYLFFHIEASGILSKK